MKRLLPSAILALLIHILFLYMESGWLKGKPLVRPKINSVTMTLVQMKKDAPKPVLKKPYPLKQIKPAQQKVREKIKTPVKKEKPTVKPVITHQPQAKQEPIKEKESSELGNTVNPVDAKPDPPEIISDESIPETTIPDNDRNKTTIIKTATPLYKLNPRP